MILTNEEIIIRNYTEEAGNLLEVYFQKDAYLNTTVVAKYFNKKPSDKTGYIYFIEEVDTGYIKVGFSKNPQARLEQLQTGNASKLLLRPMMRCNGIQDEKALHKPLESYHLHDEWFKLN